MLSKCLGNRWKRGERTPGNIEESVLHVTASNQHCQAYVQATSRKCARENASQIWKQLSYSQPGIGYRFPGHMSRVALGLLQY
jgi:hypothetical protein